MKKRDPRYPGLLIVETKRLKCGSDIVLPPCIFVAVDYCKYYGEAILQHGYGHYLQYKKHGFLYYYFVIAPVSIWAAFLRKDDLWCEKEANRLAHEYFGKESLMGTKYFPY